MVFRGGRRMTYDPPQDMKVQHAEYSSQLSFLRILSESARQVNEYNS